MKLKHLDIMNNAVLSPMAGYTDVGFRRLCAKFGAGITYTEMVSAKAMMYDSEKTKELLFVDENEKIKAVQIFGHEVDVMQSTVKNPLLEKFDIVDINMGCPAPKIIKNHEGSFLMTNQKLAGDIVRACVDATEKPITVKMRLGYGNDNVAVEFAKEMERAGASLITVHGRTQSQGYSGEVDYETIKNVKSELSIPVFANGDITDREKYLSVLDYTKADGAMIGRGALGNPMIFSQILKPEKNIVANKYDLIDEHINTLKNYYDERFIVLNMRKHIAYYLKNTGADNTLKQKLMVEENLENVLKMLKEFFGDKQQKL